jgi:hypothetical protein
MKNTLIIVFALLSFSSCQKVINVNLNDAAPKYVITGNVTNEPGPYTVKVSKTIAFSQDNTFPGISGAAVCITDSNLALTDTLSELSPGTYHTHNLTGIPGHTYKLMVAIGSSSFHSSSTMPQPITLDTVYTAKSAFGKNVNVVPWYNDPAAFGNSYHLVLKVRDSISNEIYVHNDQFLNGGEVKGTLRNEIDIHTGDPVTVELQCVDNAVYQYYRDLSQTIQQNSAAPANPQSNITGGTLGYFSAHTVDRRTIIAP